jgi:CheY-like chemotaxis protein
VSTIVVADDNPLNFELARDVLQSAGHEVLSAKDGTQAIDSVRSLQVDLVLLELRLPNADGLQVLNTIRTDPVLRQIRVLVVSADPTSGVREWVIRAGADGYLAKPFKVKELVREVERLLQLTPELSVGLSP